MIYAHLILSLAKLLLDILRRAVRERLERRSINFHVSKALISTLSVRNHSDQGNIPNVADILAEVIAKGRELVHVERHLLRSCDIMAEL
jgi:hypothetical protein